MMKHTGLIVCKGMKFTLIEFLIVISIIAILAGLLFPALGKAKNKSTAIKCLANLKQIATADAQYQNDNHDYLVPLRTEMSKGACWAGNYAGTQPGKGLLVPYIKTNPTSGANSVFQCPEPSYQKALRNSTIAYNRFPDEYGGYGLNLALHGWMSGSTVPRKISAIKRSSELLSIGEGTSSNAKRTEIIPYQQISYSFVMTIGTNTISGVTPYDHFRHDNLSANYVWADGHATAEHAGFIKYPAINLGQLGRYEGDMRYYHPDWEPGNQ